VSVPANLRGWGSGWPNCNAAAQRWVVAARSRARWQVHAEIAPIVQFLVDATEAYGYLFHRPGQVVDDWGFNCRPIAGTRTPSNHSWGLAIDIDATKYPQGTRRFPPAWLVALFESYGFEWGGRWRTPDPMHFEFRGSRTEARHMVAMLAAGWMAGKPAPLPPVEFPTPLPPAPPPYQGVPDMFLTIAGMGIWACVPGIKPIFISAAELAHGQKNSPGVPTMALPASAAPAARAAGL